MASFPVGSLAYVSDVPAGFVYPVKGWYMPTVKKGDVFKVSSRNNGWIRAYKVSGQEDIKMGRVRFRTGPWLKTSQEVEKHIDSMGGHASKVDQLIRTNLQERSEKLVNQLQFSEDRAKKSLNRIGEIFKKLEKKDIEKDKFIKDLFKKLEKKDIEKDKELTKCYEKLAVWADVLAKYTGLRLDEIYDDKCDRACLETEIDYNIQMKISEAISKA